MTILPANLPPLDTEQIKIPENDAKWVEHFDKVAQNLNVELAVIQQIKAGGGFLSAAEEYAKSVYNKEFQNEEGALLKSHQFYIQSLKEAKERVAAKQKFVDEIEQKGQHISETGRKVDIPSDQKRSILFAHVAGWVVYLFGLTSTAFVLVQYANMDWVKAFVLPFAGVSVLVLGCKMGFQWVESWGQRTNEVVKYAILYTGLICAASWLWHFSGSVADVMGKIEIQSIDQVSGNGGAESKNKQLQLMVWLGAFGEAMIAAFLFRQAGDIKRKFTFNTEPVNTAVFERYKNELNELIDKVSECQSRILHITSLENILSSTRNRLQEEAKRIYHSI
jgi:hypothetical protein